MSAEIGYPAGRGNRGTMRAADADRDRAAGILGTAYSEGRLSRDEYDARLEVALSARTYGELDHVLADLPAPPSMWDRPVAPAPAVPVAKTNAFAIASLACGLGQFVFGPLPTIPAIVFGHLARRQISRTGERGGGYAIAGLVLGWGTVVVAALGLAAMLAIAGAAATLMPTP